MKIALHDAWSHLPSSADIGASDPSADDVRDALARIIAHPLFSKSIKLQRFLAYVVEESLAGRADRLKAYNIATIALGRPDSFDPSQDPIVRVEASRLRRALSAYYTSEGLHDPVRIQLNAGSYQPIFEWNAIGAATLEPASADLAMSQSLFTRPRLADGMNRRERVLLGLIVLLFLVTFSNTAMLMLTVKKLDEVERAFGLGPTAISEFQAP
jgi:hypothetical protein